MTSAWTASLSDKSTTGLFCIRSPDAPASVGLTDPNIARLADHLIAATTTFEMAHFVALAHNHVHDPEAPETWEALRRGLAAFDDLRNEVGAMIQPESLTATADPDGQCWAIRASFKAASGQVVHRRVGVALRGDGSSPEADVQFICTLPSVVRRRLAETKDAVLAVRQIATEVIVIDAADAAMFDGADWEARGSDIVRRSDGTRLADILAQADGIWNRAVAPTITGITRAPALDYRKHRLVVRPTAVEVRGVVIPPVILDRLRDAARAHGGDMGRAVAALLGGAP